MTAHPQTQPMPGTVPAAAPIQPVAEEVSPKPKGASRNARIVLGLSLLVATAGVSFAVGHLTAEEAAGTAASPFAAGAFPVAAMGAADTTSETAAVDPASTGGSASTGSEPGGASTLSAVTLVETESEDALAAEAAPPAAPPDGAMGQRGAIGGMPGGTDGTVAEISDASLTITAADGSEQTFAIDGTTSWVQQEVIDASAVQAGDEVSVQVPFAGPGADSVDASATAVATQVTVTAPAA